VIAYAAAIVDTLSRAGVTPAGIRCWLDRPRRELEGLSPRSCMTIGGPGTQERVVRLARVDVDSSREPASVS
jgi:hypothetical protein